ncbi:MAG: hypothetical protein A3F18_03755 [Legionellales bacterium RIFCSPHIGHO2_12_FULL_37_14]|nr:MAG: hypothetical protein A3F18_03755 [Legionellales bacterium RIFCSPHIGHO2_12_FULL_37_14]
MTKLTAEIIARSIFGCDLGKENAQKIADGFSHYQSNIGAFNLLALFGLPHFMTYLSSRGIRRPAKQVTSVIEDLIHSYFNENKAAFAVDVCLAKNDARKPFLEFLRIKKQNSDKLDWQAIRDEAAVIFMAGHETTANCLAWAFFLLSQAPKVAKKLYQEIDSVLGQRLPIHADIGKLVYTRAIIEETLRLYPPIPILSRQVKKAESIGRYNIPKGALLLVVPWLLHRHKLFWEKPDFFIPERFLPNSPAIDQYLYIPFSVGPRVCAGMNFGLTEAILCLATLSQALQFKLVPNTTIQAVSHLALRPDDGNGRLPLIMQKREKGNV